MGRMGLNCCYVKTDDSSSEVSEETREKFRQIKKQWWKENFDKKLEYKKRLDRGRQALDGSFKKHTKETKRKISEASKGERSAWYGKTLSDEHKRKISNSLSGSDHIRARRVAKVDKSTGEILKVYYPYRDVRHDGFTPEGVCSVLRGVQKTYHGYKWQYVD